MANETAKGTKSHEQVVAEFQTLRSDQRKMVSNIAQLELDLKEHKTVIDTLKTVDENRKCFRLVGGVLCERTVAKVLPELIEVKDQLEFMVSRGNEQMSKKGEEINKFIEVNNIRFKGQESLVDPKAEAAAVAAASDDSQGRKQILVTN